MQPCKYPPGLFISLAGLRAKVLELICPGRTVSPAGDQQGKHSLQSLQYSVRHSWCKYIQQVYVSAIFHNLKCLSESLMPFIADLVMAASLCWSCHAPVMCAWRQIVAVAIFFFIFLSVLFGRPLAATIDPRVELMTKMTNPWGAQVREIEQKMEGKRPRLAHYRPRPPSVVEVSAHRGEMPYLCSTGPSFFHGGDPGAPS